MSIPLQKKKMLGQKIVKFMLEMYYLLWPFDISGNIRVYVGSHFEVRPKCIIFHGSKSSINEPTSACIIPLFPNNAGSLIPKGTNKQHTQKGMNK
jgi:hypothetical protein